MSPCCGATFQVQAIPGTSKECFYTTLQVPLSNISWFTKSVRAIVGLVIFIQKLVRGALARKLAKRMRAAYRIGLFYRRVKYLKLIRVLESSYK